MQVNLVYHWFSSRTHSLPARAVRGALQGKACRGDIEDICSGKWVSAYKISICIKHSTRQIKAIGEGAPTSLLKGAGTYLSLGKTNESSSGLGVIRGTILRGSIRL